MDEAYAHGRTAHAEKMAGAHIDGELGDREIMGWENRDRWGGEMVEDGRME